MSGQRTTFDYWISSGDLTRTDGVLTVSTPSDGGVLITADYPVACLWLHASRLERRCSDLEAENQRLHQDIAQHRCRVYADRAEQAESRLHVLEERARPLVENLEVWDGAEKQFADEIYQRHTGQGSHIIRLSDLRALAAALKESSHA